MNQVLLYSINPEHLANILNGHKTIEVRKRDLPQWAKDKLASGEKVVGYGYCTKAEPYLNKDMGNWFLVRGIDYIGYPVLNGLVVVKFEVSETTFLSCGSEAFNSITKKSCLTLDDLINYCDGKDLYAHHLTNIQPIEPMELGEFLKEEYAVMPNGIFPSFQPLTKAPQSFMTCWVKGE